MWTFVQWVLIGLFLRWLGMPLWALLLLWWFVAMACQLLPNRRD